MKTNRKTPPYQTYNRYQSEAKYEESIKSTLTTQILLCTLLLSFCILVRYYPGNFFVKTKNSITLIVSHNTDIPAILQKAIDSFKPDEKLKVLDPVSTLSAPSSGKIVKGFGMQDASSSGFHYGVDISVKKNEDITSANDGKITEIATNREHGSFVIICHSDEISTLYGNLNEILVSVGDSVTKGQPIARADSDAFYFELRRGDTYLDPAKFIDFEE